MKVRHFKDESKIKMEDLDDLWYLKSVLDKGDEIQGVSYRRVRDETKARADKGQRVRLYLGVKMEEAELHHHSKSLRITGPLVHSSDPNISLGSYHTIEAGVGDTLTIKKRWKPWQMDRLKDAQEASRTGLILLVSIEEGEADFAILRRYGIDYAFRVTETIAGKEFEVDYESSVKGFYKAVAKQIKETMKREGISAVILCGPGFSKEKVHDILKDGGVSGLHMEPSGCGGRPGIQEVLKRGAVEKIMAENKVAIETRLVEELFRRVSVDDPAVYGPAEVERAAAMGAVETLLVTYTFLQEHSPDRLLASVKNQRGEVHVVSPEHDAGERLNGIGGIAAILRFPIA